MQEISLNILDIVQNSIKAEATFIHINIEVNSDKDLLIVEIKDNGKGMTKEEIRKVEDPFYTTRTTRSIGLGIPFFKHAAQSTKGQFQIESQPGIGTTVKASFILSHIDRMPLGNMVETIHLLITMNPDIDYIYSYKVNKKEFLLDTKELHEILGDVPLNLPEVSTFIKEYLQENHDEVNQGKYI